MSIEEIFQIEEERGISYIDKSYLIKGFSFLLREISSFSLDKVKEDISEYTKITIYNFYHNSGFMEEVIDDFGKYILTIKKNPLLLEHLDESLLFKLIELLNEISEALKSLYDKNGFSQDKVVHNVNVIVEGFSMIRNLLKTDNYYDFFLTGDVSVLGKIYKQKIDAVNDVLPNATANFLSEEIQNRINVLKNRSNLWLISAVVSVFLVSIYSIIQVNVLDNKYKDIEFNDTNEKLDSLNNASNKIFDEQYNVDRSIKKYLLDSVEIPKVSRLGYDSLILDSLTNLHKKTLTNIEEVKSKVIERRKKNLNINLSRANERNSIGFWLKRVLIVSPMIYLIVFCFSQYNKERKLLEIYAHKRVVSQSLPAFMEQMKTDEGKENIINKGADVIFSLPETDMNKNEVSSESTLKISDVKNLLDIKGKVV